MAYSLIKEEGLYFPVKISRVNLEKTEKKSKKFFYVFEHIGKCKEQSRREGM